MATLLLKANRVVSSGRLVEAVWGGDPPETAANALQVHVSPDGVVWYGSGPRPTMSAPSK